MQTHEAAQFAAAKTEVASWITADRAFDLIYHLCDALHDQRFVATSRVLEDALDTYLSEAKRIRPAPLIEGSLCPPEKGERLRRAIERMRQIESGYRPLD